MIIENLLTEEQIKEILGLEDWRNLTKDKVVDLVNCFTKASPETIKEILTQILEIKETSKEILAVSKEYYETIQQSNEKITDSIIESANHLLKSIKKTIDDDEELTFEQKNILLDKQIELIKMLYSLDTKNKIFLKHLSDNWGNITLISVGFICGVVLLATGNGKVLIDSIKNIGKEGIKKAL